MSALQCVHEELIQCQSRLPSVYTSLCLSGATHALSRASTSVSYGTWGCEDMGCGDTGMWALASTRVQGHTGHTLLIAVYVHTHTHYDATCEDMSLCTLSSAQALHNVNDISS